MHKPMRLLALFVVILSTHALKRRVAVRLSDRNQLSGIFRFRCADGCDLSADISMNNDLGSNETLYFLLINDKEIDDFGIVPFCNDPLADAPYPTLALGGNQTDADAIMRVGNSKDWYRLATANCAGERFVFTVDWVAVNPNGEFLSLNDVPYKGLYVSFVVFWAAVAMLWGYHCWTYKNENVNYQLQVLMLTVPVSRTVFSLFYVGYFYHASKSGNASDGLFWTAFFCEAISIGALFGCFLYLSKGWANNRKELSPLEVPQIWIIAVIVIVVQWLYLFFSPYFVAIVVVTYVVVLWFCYSKMQETVTILGTRLRDVQHDGSGNTTYSHGASSADQTENFGQDENTPAVTTKRQFLLFSRALLAYLVWDAFILLLAPLAMSDYLWVRDMLQGFATLAVVVFVGWVFRHKQYHAMSIGNDPTSAIATHRASFTQAVMPPDQENDRL